MKKTRFWTLLLVAIMIVGCLTGCGKTEEEKAKEEIAQKIEQGIEEDKKEHEEFQEAQKDKSEITKKLNENEVKALSEAYKAWMQVREGDNAEDVVAAAKAYNEAFNAYVKAATDSGVFSDAQIKSTIMSLGTVYGEIPEVAYMVNANYIKHVEDLEYENLTIAYNDSAYVFYVSNDVDGMVVRADGTTCEIKVSELVPGTKKIKIEMLTDKELVLELDGVVYGFDITSEKATIKNEMMTESDFNILTGMSNKVWNVAKASSTIMEELNK